MCCCKLNRMKKTGIVALFFLIYAGLQTASAQYYFYDNSSLSSPVVFELGGSVGSMNCLTDIGGKQGLGKPFLKDLNFGKMKLSGGIFLSASYNEAITLRLEGTWGGIRAYDSILADVKSSTNGRYERNLSFRSRISEISAIAEIHPLFLFVNWSYRDMDPPRISPYLLGGVGFFSFNPQAKNRDGKYVDLQPLSLEGQGFRSYPDRQPYKLSQINFPVGFGVRYELSGAFNLRAEVVHRIVNTDYLDDVSTRYIDPLLFSTEGGLSGNQLRDAIDLSSNDRNNPGGPTGEFRKTSGGIRGNPKNNDSFFSINFKIGYNFGRQSR